MIWHNLNKLPDNFSTDLTNGFPGKHIPSQSYYGATTSYSGTGSLEKKLTLPMNSMLFNFLDNEYILKCDENIPPIPCTTPKGGDGVYKFQWQSSVDLLNWMDAAGQNNKEDYTPEEPLTRIYHRRIVASNGYTDTSNVFTLSVGTDLQNNIIEADQEICEGEEILPMKTGGEPVNGGNEKYQYIWESRIPGFSWSPDNNANDSPEYLPSNPGPTTEYRRIVNSARCTDTSNILIINILPGIENNLIHVNQEICFGDNFNPLQQSGVSVSGGSGSYMYAWEFRSGTEEWTEDQKAKNSPEYLPESPVSTSEYRRIVSSGLCLDTSNTISILVYNPPLITGQPADQEAEKGSSVTFSVQAESSEALSYTWMHPSGLTVPDANEFTIENVQEKHEGLYYCIVRTALCESISDTAILKVKQGPTGLDKTAANVLTVYPNPASDVLFISNIGEDEITVKIYNLLGKLKSEYFNTSEIDVSMLEPGQYIIRISNPEHSFTTRFLISR